MAGTRHPQAPTLQLRAAVAVGDYATVVRLARRTRGLTQDQLGARVGYSAATISRLETGQQALHDIDTLRLLARELAIPPSWLGLSPLAPDDTTPDRRMPALPGVPPVRVEADVAAEEEAVQRRRFLAGLAGITTTALFAPGQPADAATLAGRLEQVLTGAAGSEGASAATVVELRRALATARTVFDACRYDELSLILPRIVTTARGTAEHTSGHDRDQTLAQLSDAYALTSELAVKLNQDGMAWVAADRALTAANRSGDVVAVGGAARSVAIAMRRQGRHDGAISLLTRVALGLGADTGEADPEVLGVYAALLCTAAYSCAQNGRRAQALDLIGEAEQAAGRLPDTVRRGRLPTPANVGVYRIGIHTALGEPGIALDHARTVNHSLLPTPERHARYCVDTARAWEQYGRPNQAVQALLIAERLAPQEINRPSVATLISGMLYGPGPTPVELRALAVRSGIA
ncbi:helix-turn-helix transcriptional regulator [Acrocarpospora sp. B8E8]|uniref:helix-turn-helix domain-containing protein n=1 Tax=Acrocarpospora sp. B8E8 TaxID=3153572 RepID=UPI00325E98AE